MSVLVYCEHEAGKFKKSTYEAVSYAAAISGDALTAIAIGDVSTGELQTLSKYGVSRILHAADSSLTPFSNMAYAVVIAEAVKHVDAKVVVMSSSFSGKDLAPRVAVRLEAAYVNGAVALPDQSSGFVVKSSAYSGKAYTFTDMLSPVKVISVAPNAFSVTEKNASGNIEPFSPQIPDSAVAVRIRETVKASDKISLPEAELVVSGGRGLKGPENWGMIEELASLLGAATACSKPVSDAHWRPHSEHVGQTGISISPNLYIAVGISGAIQHLAGVSASKTIVVINKDPEAPFFKAADYGIVGDAFEVLPKMIESVKKLKSSNA